MERLLLLLEMLIVRYQLIGGGRTGLLEIAAARLAEQTYRGAAKPATVAHHAIKDIFPSDKEFRESFAVKQERTSNKVQYLLKALERENRRRRAAEGGADELEPTTLTVEHIFPRNPRNKWDEVQNKDPQFADDCTYRLGNLTLLSGVNRDLGQSGFVDKKRSYAKSSLYITKNLGKYAQWDRAAIDARQNELAKLAVSVWRFQ
jgi:hypothetical protein